MKDLKAGILFVLLMCTFILAMLSFLSKTGSIFYTLGYLGLSFVLYLGLAYQVKS
jgi:hypothetical protein